MGIGRKALIERYWQMGIGRGSTHRGRPARVWRGAGRPPVGSNAGCER